MEQIGNDMIEKRYAIGFIAGNFVESFEICCCMKRYILTSKLKLSKECRCLKTGYPDKHTYIMLSFFFFFFFPLYIKYYFFARLYKLTARQLINFLWNSNVINIFTTVYIHTIIYTRGLANGSSLP